MNHPKVFISYAWESEDHKVWVRDLAARLRNDGVDAVIDQWETVPGDQLPLFMESAVRSSAFVLVICSPQYKAKSDERRGGVGYEGDLMTAEVFTGSGRRKFIPILRKGDWASAAPSWLLGTYYLDLRGSPFKDASYAELLATLLGKRTEAPALGSTIVSLAGDFLTADINRIDITDDKLTSGLFGKLLSKVLMDFLGLPSLLEIQSRLEISDCIRTGRFTKSGSVGALWHAILGGEVRSAHATWDMRARYQRKTVKSVGEDFAVRLEGVQLTTFVNRSPGRYYVLPQWFAPRDMSGKLDDSHGWPDSTDSLIGLSSDLILVENIAVRRFGLGDVRLRPRSGRVLLNAVDVSQRTRPELYDLKKVTPRQLGCSPWFSAASPMGFPVVVSEGVFFSAFNLFSRNTAPSTSTP